MSEYQYYEFQRVDGRLNEMQMQELRSYSSRARITPASFINEYNFGSFKGNPNAWMEKYFDGFLYLANWGSREVQLAIPAGLLPLKTAEQYCSSQAASSREIAGKLIFTFLSEDTPDEEWLEGGGNLSPLMQIRNELTHGDFRSLYLGWLMGVQSGELEPTQPEPPVPPNLGELSGAQANLAEFFRLDPDLLAAAAQKSPCLQTDVPNDDDRSAWIASLSARAKDELLIRVMDGNASGVGMELQSQFRSQRQPSQSASAAKPRTVAGLLSAAKVLAENRQREQQMKAALEKARLAQQAALARERHLESLKGRSEQIWTDVETLTATRLPKSYDQAVQHLDDLRELADREGHQDDFNHRLATFRSRHSAKKSLTDRLKTRDL